MSCHFLKTLRLDATQAAARAGPDPAAHAFMLEAAALVLAGIPSPFIEALHNVPVLLEERPSIDEVRAGFDPRALGMFEGLEHAQLDGGPLPARVVLFSANLLAECSDRDELSEQIEITILHEIGYFFGLDEDGVERLGLA